MYKTILFDWLFHRIFGLKDFKKFYNIMKKKLTTPKKSKELELKFTINVINDKQIDSGVEPMDAGKQTCPTWYSTRIFYGNEKYPTDKSEAEYWYGCRETFLAPIIPIPICSEEVIIKLGNNMDAYHECFNKYGRMHSMLDHKEEYSHLIIDECSIQFNNCDILYRNDPVYSVYYD